MSETFKLETCRLLLTLLRYILIVFYHFATTISYIMHHVLYDLITVYCVLLYFLLPSLFPCVYELCLSTF